MTDTETLPVTCGLLTTGGRAVPLLGVSICGEVTGSHARVAVRQRYRNDETKPIEAVYTFPLPSESTLTGFSMTCAGRTLEGVVKEREEAFRSYDDAISAGHGAALLDQERPNVFTAQVGNLLPGEETLVEVVYVQRTEAEEGSLRLVIPTLVAPRYVPGVAKGARTAGGWAEPTDRVPDADRVTPRLDDSVSYGLALDLVFDLGAAVNVESPSHALNARAEEDGRVRVSLAAPHIALDRDLVLLASPLGDVSSEPFTVVRSHRGETGPGTFSVTVVPDLTARDAAVRAVSNDVVFVIDVSGSMSGASLPQAVSALRLCLRHLRAGDRFNVIAFSDDIESFRGELVPFTEKSLEEADRFAARLRPRGGTRMLEPLLEAVGQAPDGVVVLLTDGQVANEDEILGRVLAQRRGARVFSFGIGTNVSDALLAGLARNTDGAVEAIYPGERIDEKVVAQFSRATAERVTDVSLAWNGVDAGELAPSDPRTLVDGEPWTLFGRHERPGSGTLTLRGTFRGAPWSLEVPIELPERAERPTLVKLWAAERVKELLAAELVGRRARAMKDRIVALAVEHGIATPYTSFVVVETRSGARRATGQPETRFVPVNLPYGWAMFQAQRDTSTTGAVLCLAMPAAAPRSAVIDRAARAGRSGGLMSRVFGKSAQAAPPQAPPDRDAHTVYESAPAGFGRSRHVAAGPHVELLSRQLASGLWAGDGSGSETVRRVRATVRALAELELAGITTRHRLHGAQVKKAVEALLAALETLDRSPDLVEAALAIAWLVSAPRARKLAENAAARLAPRLVFTEDDLRRSVAAA